jgi:tape measure domain-containing protein
MAAPELRLSVGLDLALLRQQISTIGTQLGGQPITLRTQFDRRLIATQYRALDRFLNSKTFTLKIKDVQLQKAAERAEALKKNLDALQDAKLEISVSGRAAVSQREARKIRTGVYRGIMTQGGKILLPVGLQPLSDSAASKFKADVVRKLGSVTIDVKANLQSAAIRGGAKTQAEIDAEVARGMQTISAMGAARMGGGDVTEAARRSQLQSRLETGGFTNEQLRQIAKQMNVSGVSKLNKGSIIQKIVADASVEMIKKFLDPQAVMRNPDRSGVQRVLDTFARGVFHMLGMDPAQLAAQRRASLAPSAVNWPAQVPPRQRPDIGPSSSGRLLAGTPSRAALAGDRGPAALLPSVAASAAANAAFRNQIKASVDAIVGKISSQAKATDAAGALGPYLGTIQDSFRKLFAAYGRVIDAEVRQVAAPFDIVKDFGARQVQSEARAFGRSLTDALQQARREIEAARVRAVRVGDLGAPMQAALSGQRIAGLLPSAADTSTQDRIAQAYQRSAARGLSVMAEGTGGGGPPRLPPGVGRTPAPYGGGRGGFPSDGMMEPSATRGYEALSRLSGALSSTDRFFRQTRLPLAGAVEELAGEFGQATKQVLLYGAAYKGLAFIMDLPRQTLQAATTLQTLRNQLQAVTGSTEEAGRSFQFLGSLANQFSVPLDSVRQGFVRMYASMQPAGFGAEEIEGLFTGITKAAATFGMSADKVDRVTYALSQMASKGQITAEELRGQLGDVLPGSLALFAEAAQMTIPEFSKAMEDGAFRGKAMQQVLNNVATLLNSKFSAGAKGASQTLQGALNAMQNSLLRLYEAFEPLVNTVARTVFPVIADAIGEATKAVQAFAAAAAGNEAPGNMLDGLARRLFVAFKQISEIGQSLARIIASLGPTFEILGRSLLLAVEQAARFVNTPIGTALAGFAAKAGVALIAVQLLTRTGIAALVSQLIILIRNVRLAGGGLTAFAAAAGRSAVAARLLRTAITGLFLGGVLLGIEALVTHIGKVANRLSDARKEALSAAQAIRSMGATELVTEKRTRQANVALLEGVQRSGGNISSEADRKRLEEMGLQTGTRGLQRRVLEPSLVEGYLQRERQLLTEVEYAYKGLDEAAAPPVLTPVDLQPSGDPGKAARTAEDDAAKQDEQDRLAAERLANQQQQLITKTAEHQAQLRELAFSQDQNLADDKFEQAKRLIDYEYDYRLARANEIQSVQLNLEKKLAQARIGSLKAISERTLAIREAQLKVENAKALRAAAARAAAVPVPAMQSGTIPGAPSPLDLPPASGGTISKEVLRQWLFSQGMGRTSGDFTNRGHRTPNHMLNAMDMGFTDPKYDRNYVQKTKEMEARLRATGAFGNQLFGPTSDPRGHATHLHIPTPGGRVPLTPGLAQLMGTQGGAAPASGPAFSMVKREQEQEFSVEQAEAEQKAKTNMANLELGNKLLEEARSASLAIGESIGQAFPTEQLKLDNQVLAERNRLVLEGTPSEVIEGAEKLVRARENYAAIETAIKNEVKAATGDLVAYNSQLASGSISADEHARATKALNDLLAVHETRLENLPEALRSFEAETLRATLAQLKHADALKAMEEAIGMVNSAVEGALSSYKELFVDIMSGGDIKEAAKRMQESLSKQVFTMFIDFSMKPVEKFFKDQLLKMFGLPNEEEKRQQQIAEIEKQLAAMRALTDAVNRNTTAQGGQVPTATPAPAQPVTPTSPSGVLPPAATTVPTGPQALQVLPYSQRFDTPSSIVPPAAVAPLAAMPQIVEETMAATADATQQSVDRLKLAYGGSVNFMDLAAKELDKNNVTWQQNLGKTVSAVGIAASSIMGIVAGVSQIKEGGVSGVLGGIGSIAMGLGSALGGFSSLGGLGGLFGGGGGAAALGGGSGIPWNFNTGLKFFANGGVVNGPTLGMVGEGRYNEAIVPLPDGRSIPVKMNDQSASLREAMNTMSPMQAMAPILSMKFESTNIGGVEYVSRDQLEAAMASTRRQAAKDGALRGMNMTLDKIQQSPATRSRIGMRGR